MEHGKEKKEIIKAGEKDRHRRKTIEVCPTFCWICSHKGTNIISTYFMLSKRDIRPRLLLGYGIDK